jgi:hypothetical protein
MKVIPVCGSLKFKDEIIKAAIQMELAGNIALCPIFPITNDKNAYTEGEVIMFGKMHKEKIKLSDAILVVNVNEYIRESTKRKIDFAKSLNKKIIYYTDLI